jgi:ornithine--oxo-acid transaminase
MTSSKECMQLEHDYAAHNYHPLPVVISKASGIWVWDVEENKYLDFLSSYSSVNQGHCHPKILNTLVEQASKLTLSSRAFHNDMLGKYAKFVTEYFGMEMVLPMNTGAEAVETSIKLARKWGYMKKKIPEDKAIVITCTNNFHGRTLGIISMSSDPDCRNNFGPFLPSVGSVCPVSKRQLRYNSLSDIEEALEAHGDRIAAFLVEPIQGEAGIYVPDDGYLMKCFQLCKKHNVLFIADEIQTGLCRTGKLLAVDHEGVKPDILILGKALSGGVYPVSAVLSSKEVMLCIRPGEHGSTFGGNPLACAVAISALEVLRDEKLAENAEALGQIFRSKIREINCPFISLVRGRGLLNAVVIDEVKLGGGKTAWDLCLILKKNGLLAKPTHQNIIRLAPPLVITENEIDLAVDIFKKSLKEILEIPRNQIPN